MASGCYDLCRTNWLNKECDMEGDSFIIILLDNTHTFATGDDNLAAVTANQLATAGGYTQDTKALASMAVTDAAAVKWDADDVAWAAATFSAWHAVIYDDTIAGDTLILSVDFAGEQQVVGGTFTIEWNAAGVLTVS